MSQGWENDSDNGFGEFTAAGEDVDFGEDVNKDFEIELNANESSSRTAIGLAAAGEQKLALSLETSAVESGQTQGSEANDRPVVIPEDCLKDLKRLNDLEERYKSVLRWHAPNGTGATVQQLPWKGSTFEHRLRTRLVCLSSAVSGSYELLPIALVK